MVDTADQSVQWVSDGFAEHFGLPTTEFTGRSIFAFLEGSPNEPWQRLFTGIESVDERFHNVRIHSVGEATSLDEFELRGVRYVDAGRNVMVSLRAPPSAMDSDHSRMLAEVEHRHAALLHRSSDGVIVHDGTFVVFVNESAARLIGVLPADAVGMPIVSLIDPEGSSGAVIDERADDGFDSRRVRLWLRRAPGAVVAVDASMALVSWSGEKAVQIVVHDLSLEHHSQRSDAVLDVVENAASDAVISTDENLQIVDWNASASELYGWSRDEVVGLAIGEVLGRADTCLGIGDSTDSPSDSDAWRGTVRHRHRDGHTLLVESAQMILRYSDGALGGLLEVNRPAEVGAGDDSTSVPILDDPLASLDPSDSVPPGWVDDAAFAADLRDAIANGAISVAYQPIVDLDTGRLHHVEALARWNHSQRGAIRPGWFIPVAERSGVIDELGEWILKKACADVLLMCAEGIDVHLNVNLSVVQLRDPSVAHRIAGVLTNSGFAPERLWIEVTESVLIDDQGLLPLHELHDLGAHLVIDDFGTGYASFQYLTRLPIDALKIDTTFVSGLGVEPNDTAIVRSVVNLGHELGLEVVAEGVETEFQRAQLLVLNCHLGQGWLFGRALSRTELVARYSNGGARKLPRSSATLTKRELEIVRSLLAGDRVPAIAHRLFLSQSTVRNHLSSIYSKLGVSSQQQLVDRFRTAPHFDP